jgi:hypothetical protein
MDKKLELDLVAENWESARESARKIAQDFGVRIIAEIENGPGGGNACFIFEGARERILDLQKFWG